MYEKTTFENGLRVLTMSVPHAYSVSVGAFIGAGSRYESDEIGGASHFIEHVLFKGTRRWPTARELSEAVESVGGVINASTGPENTTLWCRVARHDFPLALSVLSDMLRWPLMDADEIGRERGVIVEEVRMTKDHPSYHVGTLIDSVLWPDQPLGRDVAGTIESVTSVTREQLYEYYKRQYSPDNTVLCVAGNVSHQEVVDEVARSLDGWERQEWLPWYPYRDVPDGQRLVVDVRQTDQVHMCIGLPGLAREHPDRRALDLLNRALGEGMSSRLFTELREKRGLVYDVHSGLSHLRDCGSLVVYCGVEPSKALQAAELVMEELERLKEGLLPGELEKVRAMARGRLLLQMESTSNLSVWGGSQELLTGRVKTVEDVVAEIEGVTAEDVKRVASELVQRRSLRMAIVGPVRDQDRYAALLDG